jgi:hypothetical protein
MNIVCMEGTPPMDGVIATYTEHMYIGGDLIVPDLPLQSPTRSTFYLICSCC